MTKDKSKILDQFYTNPLVSDMCTAILLKVLKEQEYKDIVFLEPSAGTGNFIRSIEKICCYSDYKGMLKNIIAYDIDPKDERIIKLDYLKTSKKRILNKKKFKIVVVGNPPFGKKSSLAIKFINKSFDYSDVISFIVPLQFEKWSVQSRIDKNLKLIFSQRLENKAFIFNDKEKTIRCCFQIWVNKQNKEFENFNNVRILKKPKTSHRDFEMYQYNNTKDALKFFNKEKYNWDFAVPRQGYYDYNMKIYKEEELSEKIQWIFFKAKNEKVLENLKKINFEKLSLNNTTIPGFGKADVIEEYNNLYKEE